MVFWEYTQGADEDDESVSYLLVNPVDAGSAEQACRLAAGNLPSAPAEELEKQGVTLIAVPARNWTSGRNTFKAETRRRLLRS